MPDPYSPETVVRGLFEALNARDHARAMGAIAEDCEWWSMPAEQLHRGPVAIIAGLDQFASAFPDWRADIERVTASGEIAVVEWVSQGTFRGEFRGRLPNGKKFRRCGCSVAVVRKARIVHYRDYFDRAGILEQLDLLDLI